MGDDSDKDGANDYKDNHSNENQDYESEDIDDSNNQQFNQEKDEIQSKIRE